ncbi:MAG: DUF359 domain-containing protein [Sulfolobales archaeon]
MMRALRLPDELRQELSRPVGYFIEGLDHMSVALRALNIIRGRRCWCVGDQVVRSFINAGFVPDIAVIDRKTSRSKPVDMSDVEKIYRDSGSIHIIRNPPGYINLEVIDLIREISSDRGRHHLVIVEGEEDLISLAVLGYAPIGDVLIYGIPGRGIVIIFIDPDMKSRALDVMRRMTLEEIRV